VKKRFLLLILMLICTVMLLSACGSNNKTVGDSVPNNAENSVDSTEVTEAGSNSGEGSGESDGTDISVTPPKGWKRAGSGEVHLVDYSNGTAHFWVEKNFIDASNTDLDKMAHAAKSGYEGSYVFRNIEFIGEAESITVDGKDARKLVFNYETSQASGSKKMKREDVFLILGEDFYTIVFEDTSDSFDKLAGDFEQILKSISFKF
jgi:outer membrane lipoprotein-sorting protein